MTVAIAVVLILVEIAVAMAIAVIVVLAETVGDSTVTPIENKIFTPESINQ
jgi:hypothetical protein